MKKIMCIVLPILLLLAGIRIAAINIDVQNKIPSKEVFPFGAVVPLGNTFFFSEGESIEGYTIQVKKADIVTMDEFLGLYNQTRQYLIDTQFSDWFDHVYLVHVTFTNESNDYYGEQGVDLFHYKLVGPDYYLQVFDEMFDISNPKLQSGTKFTMEKGKSFDVVLPFTINTKSETATSIEYVQRTKPRLLVSQYPTKLFLELSKE